MTNATQNVWMLERAYREKKCDARLVPWHAGILPLIIGIIMGVNSGIHRHSVIAKGTDILSILLLSVLSLMTLVFLLILRHAARHPNHKNLPPMLLVSWLIFCLSLGIWLGCPTASLLMPENESCQIIGKIVSAPPGTSQTDVQIVRYQCARQSGHIDMNARIKLDHANDVWTKNMWFSAIGRFERYPSPRTPGVFDIKAWARMKGIAGQIFLARDKNNDPVIRPYDEQRSFAAHLEMARRHAYQKMTAESPNGIAPALVLGASRDISNETRNTFARVGIAHILAVSGLHFGLIAMMVQTVFKFIFGRSVFIMRIFGRNRAALIAMIPVLFIYLLFVGAPISACRALIMLIAANLAKLFGRKSDRLRALCAAAFCLILIDPYAIMDIGFQLSFSAVLGIIWGMDFYERCLQIPLRTLPIGPKLSAFLDNLVSMLLISIATSLTTAPFVIFHFGQLPLMGIFSNLIAIPFVSFILMPAAIVTACALIIDLPFANVIAQLCALPESAFAHAASLYNTYIPLTCLDLPAHILPAAIAAICAIGMIWRLSLNRRRLIVAAAATLTLAALLTTFQIHPRLLSAPDGIRISFVAMGQADATLIELPNGKTMLIDVGNELNWKNSQAPSSVSLSLLPLLKHRNIRHIDTLVITHPDYDHIAGLPELLKNCTVGEIWHNGMSENLPWLSDAHHIPTHDVRTLPARLRSGNTQIDILWPKSFSRLSNPNESSIVLYIAYGAFSILLMGDAGIVAENAMLLDHLPMKNTTVLKVGHHGSRSASSQPWISRVNPTFAVFSVGANNTYRLPHHDVQTRFLSADIAQLRTDTNGTITMDSDGVRLFIQTMD